MRIPKPSRPVEIVSIAIRIGAEKIIDAEKEIEQIAIETKSLMGYSEFMIFIIPLDNLIRNANIINSFKSITYLIGIPKLNPSSNTI